MFWSFYTVAVPPHLVEHGSDEERPLRKLAKVVGERTSYLSVKLAYLEEESASNNARKELILTSLLGIPIQIIKRKSNTHILFQECIEFIEEELEFYKYLENQILRNVRNVEKTYTAVYKISTIALAKLQGRKKISGSHEDEHNTLRKLINITEPFMSPVCRKTMEKVRCVEGERGNIFGVALIADQKRFLEYKYDRIQKFQREHKDLIERSKDLEETLLANKREEIPLESRKIIRASLDLRLMEHDFTELLKGIETVKKEADRISRSSSEPNKRKKQIDNLIKAIEIFEEISELLYKAKQNVTLLKIALGIEEPSTSNSDDGEREKTKRVGGKGKKKKKARGAASSGASSSGAAAASAATPILTSIVSAADAAIDSSGAAAASAATPILTSIVSAADAAIDSSGAAAASAAAPTQASIVAAAIDSSGAAAASAATTLTATISSLMSSSTSGSPDSDAAAAAAGIPAVNEKPKDKESYADRLLREQAARERFTMLLRDKVIVPKRSLNGAMYGILNGGARATLDLFIENPGAEYDHAAFQRLIMGLGGRIKGIGGSEWRISLRGQDEKIHSGTYHIPHNGAKCLNPIARMILSSLFERVGLIELTQ